MCITNTGVPVYYGKRKNLLVIDFNWKDSEKMRKKFLIYNLLKYEKGTLRGKITSRSMHITHPC